MGDGVHEWAGKERFFRLAFGGVMDLEEAVGDPVGDIFLRVATSRFSVKDIYHTLRLGLIGGGMSVMDAKRLLRDQMDARPYLEHAAVAAAILTDLMSGVEPKEGEGDAENERIRFSEVSQICREFNMSPQDLRSMRYPDFVNMVRGFNAAGQRQADFLDEEEFMDILDRYEPEGALQ